MKSCNPNVLVTAQCCFCCPLALQCVSAGTKTHLILFSLKLLHMQTLPQTNLFIHKHFQSQKSIYFPNPNPKSLLFVVRFVIWYDFSNIKSAVLCRYWAWYWNWVSDHSLCWIKSIFLEAMNKIIFLITFSFSKRDTGDASRNKINIKDIWVYLIYTIRF